jgi:hypothetical protein
MMSSDPDEGSTATPSVEALLRVVEHHGLAQRFGPCTHPVHRAYRADEAGVGGSMAVRCRDRRAAICGSCSALYRLDARHLLTAGLTSEPGGRRPRVFVTLTAPSFGKVHIGPTDGRPRLCHPRHGCAVRHLPGDPAIGTALDPASYDYVGQVLFNAYAGALWAAFTTQTRRTLAADAGLSRAEAGRRVRVVFAKVAEFQTRGVVHLHAVIRLDPGDPPDLPAWATTTTLRRSVRHAARTTRATTPGSTSTLASASVPVRRLRWGRQCDVRPITAGSGEASVAVVARYIAKYATKAAETAGLNLGPIACPTCSATGATTLAPGLVRLCRACHGTGRRADIDLDRLTAHARAVVETCWRLGARPEYAPLRLRQHAHQGGFRGHFLTKSRTWSTTFAALRAERHAFAQARRSDGHPPGFVVSGRSIHDHS